MRRPKILVVGHGRHGKDTTCEYLEALTGLRFNGTTSVYLAKYVAERLGISEAEAYARRHQDRDFWYVTGNEIRDGDPTKLIRESLEESDIVGGIRDINEIEGAVREKLFDLIIWVQDDRKPPDPTLKFGSEWAHVVVLNNGRIRDLYEKLHHLATILGSYK